MTIYRAEYKDVDYALGGEKELTLGGWFDFIGQPYYHHNKRKESYKGIDFDLYDNASDLTILSEVTSQVCCEAVRLDRSSLKIGKLNFRIAEIDKLRYKPHLIWYVQVWEDDSKIVFESIEKLAEYMDNNRESQENGIFQIERPTNKDERDEEFLEIPLKRLPKRIIGGKSASHKSLHQR